ncbi:MAG: hypothetical protein LRZ85_02460 [Alphaproteobacteria bacterium]|nr:hypothetical protein [Alphaproteobacteria bacterium]
MPAKSLKKSSYPEVEDIRGDLNALKKDAIKLGNHVAADGKERLQEMSQSAKEQISSLKAAGETQIHSLEERVKAKPMQSVAIAFGAGLLASVLLGRR